MKFHLILFLLLITALTKAQLITTNPQFPVVNQPVTITYNASEGSGGLKDYTGDIYAHTGVITDKSTGSGDWKYVVAGWGENITKAKLTRISANIYTLTITPTIIDYYSVPEGEEVLQIALVFRNADGSKTGKTTEGGDIFVDVYTEGLSASLIKPEKSLLLKANDEIEIEAASNFADSLILYVDNERITATVSNTISTTITALQNGKHWIWIEAKDATSSVFDSVYYFIRDDAAIAELPEGVRKGINYINDTTVTLVLHAPEKEFIYLIGDFNNWDFTISPEANQANAWLMNKTVNGNFHWITVSGLTPQKEYAFQYFVDGDIKIADPYTEKTLDPWNDKYISDETYPGLKPYPVGKTTEPTSVFQTAQPPHEWQHQNFTMPAVEDMVVYEMHIRDFVATHSYKTVADTLNYLKNLGVNVLELMPINEFEGNSSWGYNPSFYFAPDKYYGPKDDLKKLVDEAHNLGIAVVIDLVLNHSYGQSPLVRLYFENGKPAANNPWYNVTSNFTNPDAQWGYDFNHESIYTQELVDSINSFWMSEYHIDGFRFDFTKGFGNNIKDASDSWASKYDADRIRLLKRMADEIWKRKPDAYISFEHLAENSEEKELANYGINLWGNMNNSYNEGTMGYTESGKSDLSWISYQNRGWDNPNVVGYMESHDEQRLMFKNITYAKQVAGYDIREINTGLKRVELAANFFFTIPGPKMIWQFGELGYDISIDSNGRVGEKPILWEYFDNTNRRRLYDVYAALAKLKTTEPAFSTNDFQLNVRNAVKTIHLNHADMNVVILGNFDVVAQPVKPEFQNTGTWYEYYTGESKDVIDTDADITLKAGEYRIYTTKQLEQPDITPFVGEFKQAVTNENLNVYPNPVYNELFVANGEQLVQLTISNLVGQQVYVQKSAHGFSQIFVENFVKGMYVVTGTDKRGNILTAKFIKE